MSRSTTHTNASSTASAPTKYNELEYLRARFPLEHSVLALQNLGVRPGNIGARMQHMNALLAGNPAFKQTIVTNILFDPIYITKLYKALCSQSYQVLNAQQWLQHLSETHIDPDQITVNEELITRLTIGLSALVPHTTHQQMRARLTPPGNTASGACLRNFCAIHLHQYLVDPRREGALAEIGLSRADLIQYISKSETTADAFQLVSLISSNHARQLLADRLPTIKNLIVWLKFRNVDTGDSLSSFIMLVRIISKPSNAQYLSDAGLSPTVLINMVFHNNRSYLYAASSWMKLFRNEQIMQFLSKHKPPSNNWLQWALNEQKFSLLQLRQFTYIIMDPLCRQILSVRATYETGIFGIAFNEFKQHPQSHTCPPSNSVQLFLQQQHNRVVNIACDRFHFNKPAVILLIGSDAGQGWKNKLFLCDLFNRPVIQGATVPVPTSVASMLLQVQLSREQLLTVLHHSDGHSWLLRVIKSLVQPDTQDYALKHPEIDNWMMRLARTPRFVAAIACQTQKNGLNSPSQQSIDIKQAIAQWNQKIIHHAPAPTHAVTTAPTQAATTAPTQAATTALTQAPPRVHWDRHTQLFPLQPVQGSNTSVTSRTATQGHDSQPSQPTQANP